MARHSENLLCYGDNLPMLREHIADASVDLVYLDPPFNSDASYNMLFKERDGSRAESQIKAFGDTWTWDAGAARAFDDTLAMGGSVADALRALRTLVGHSDMLAYLSMMAPRLVELRRVLKPTGSLFLHCDPTASHHLKLLLDAAFGPESFRNEIIWKRTVSHNNVRNRFGDETDTLLFYSRGPRPVFNIQYRPYSAAYKESHYSQTDPDGRRFTTRDLRNPGVRPNLHYDYKGYKPHPNGWAISLKKMKAYDAKGLLYFPADKNGRLRLKRYLDEMPGTPMGTVWDDILPLNSQAQERLGYPTQKPEALLDRIILATTNSGDVVLDPFCGCGTAVASAQRLDRRWVGIDITALAINLIEQRLVAAHGSDIKRTYRTEGEPSSAADAVHLAQNPHAFQAWVMRKLKAEPGPRGADRGIDGRKWFRDARSKKDQAIIISVKAGGISPSHLRDLRGVLEREEAAIGVLVCRNEPTREMRREAATSGFVETAWGKHARLQILTIDDIFAGKVIDCPPAGAEVTFKKAPRAKRVLAEPRELFADPLVGTALSRNRIVAAEPPPPPYGVGRKPTIKAAARTAKSRGSRKPPR